MSAAIRQLIAEMVCRPDHGGCGRSL